MPLCLVPNVRFLPLCWFSRVPTTATQISLYPQKDFYLLRSLTVPSLLAGHIQQIQIVSILITLTPLFQCCSCRPQLPKWVASRICCGQQAGQKHLLFSQEICRAHRSSIGSKWRAQSGWFCELPSNTMQILSAYFECDAIIQVNRAGVKRRHLKIVEDLFPAK
jgi:hypothetical protein